MTTQIKELNALATKMVGDNQTPNVFFVSCRGNIMMVSAEFDTAYDYWRFLPRNVETTLEDRQNGVLASTEPREDNPAKNLYTRDYTRLLGMRQ